MAQTPDRKPGPSDEEAVKFEVGSTHPTQNGELRYVSGQGFKFFEEGTERGLTTTGLSESLHRTVRQLIHFIDDGPAEGFASGAYRETLPSGDPFPTSETWWTSSAKTAKIVELATTWGSSPKVPTQEQWKVYDSDGTTVLATVTDAISYASGVFESSRTRTVT